MLLAYYGLDQLFSGTFDGVVHWVIDTGTSALVGDALSSEIADYVLSNWSWYETPPQWWA